MEFGTCNQNVYERMDIAHMKTKHHGNNEA
jgi:hypothetical protein